MARIRVCRECGAEFSAKRAGVFNCSPVCRKTFNNRRMLRGAEMYDLFMATRYEREEAEKIDARQLMSRMAQHYRLEDERERKGRKSWANIREIKERSPFLLATIITTNAAGVKRYAS